MNQIRIIQYMVSVVENYIYEKKRVEVSLNLFQILNDSRQLNMLIDAYNHIKKEYPQV